MECDLLAGERGPSYTETSQIKNWKILHKRFIEPINAAPPDARNPPLEWLGEFPESAPASPSKFINTVSNNTPILSKLPASVPLSAMLKLGKLITPKTDVVTLALEEFYVKDVTWLEPFQVRFSLQKEKFASRAFRDAYECTVRNSGWKV